MKCFLGVIVSVAFLAGMAVASPATVPYITGISPSQPTVQSGGTTIIVTGQNFHNTDRLNICYPDCTSGFRPTKYVDKQHLVVTLQAGDLSSSREYLPQLFTNAGKGSNVFAWLVTDGTIVISPTDEMVVGLNSAVQFSATSSISGDSVTWSLVPGGSYAPDATIDPVTGLFTAPSSFSSGFSSEQWIVQAQSNTAFQAKSWVVITVQ